MVISVVWKTGSTLSGLNQRFYFTYDSVHWKLEKCSAEQFSLEVTHAVAVTCQPGLDVQDGSLIQLAVDAGCQLQAQLDCRSECLRVGFLAWQSQDTWPSYMLPVSPRANIPKEPDKSFVALSDPVLKVTQHHFCCILLATRRSLSHPRLEGRRDRNYILKTGVANNLQICFKISRQYIQFYRIACILSMEQYTRGIWKTLKRMKKLLKLFCYYGIFFFIYIWKERWKEGKLHT